MIAPAFYPVHGVIKKQECSSIWLEGGRGSTKSSFAAIEIVLGIIADPEANAIAVRKVGDTIRSSLHPTFMWAIEQLKLGHLWEATYSPAVITYKPTGQHIIMKGLDDPLKLKSLKAARGYYKYLWFEEGAEFNGPQEMRNVRQSVFRGGSSFLQFLSYNPPPDPEHWINAEAKIQAALPSCYIHRSTYLDVPQHWLGEQFFKDAAELREVNPLAYENEYLGIPVGNNEAIVFAGKYRIAEFEPHEDWHGPYFGADFGFSQDPNTLVKLWIEDLPNGRQNLYVEYAEFDQGTELDDMPRFYSRVPDSQKYEIGADSARPETISHIKRRNFNIVGVEKWKGSVEDGITVLKSFVHIIIHTRCTAMHKEARLYSYKIDRLTQQVTPDIVDKHNHGWDAIRYALRHLIKRRSRGYFSA